mmetsp:Transcript_17610/g.26729  ORF Transcript_17610/g.26729 Transcript_17610/m.26729 type:complete len:85 (+) Transcript_17610:10-264(+)
MESIEKSKKMLQPIEKCHLRKKEFSAYRTANERFSVDAMNFEISTIHQNERIGIHLHLLSLVLLHSLKNLKKPVCYRFSNRLLI